jgi:hypothetical protein
MWTYIFPCIPRRSEISRETLTLIYSFFLESPLLFLEKKYLFVLAQILWSAQKGYSTYVLKITSLFIFEICWSENSK